MVLPNDDTLEQSVLACALYSQEAALAVSEQLSIHDFELGKHRTILEAIQSLCAEGKEVDTLSVQSWLKTKNMPGVADVFVLDTYLPDAARFQTYIDQLRDLTCKRRLIEHADMLQHQANEPGTSGYDLLFSAQTGLEEISNRSEKRQNLVLGPQIAEEFRAALKHQSGELLGISTGLWGLDNMTLGLCPGHLWVIAGRPGMGKSSLGMHMLRQAGIHDGKRVGLFSLEMPKYENAWRMAAAEADVPFSRIRKGECSEHERRRIERAAELVEKSSIWIDDSASLTNMEIVFRARRQKHALGLDLLVIDYLGHIKPSVKCDTRDREIGHITASLKGLSKDLNIPVVLLCQVSRRCEQRADKRPNLSDLRECLAGDSLVLDAESGVRYPVRQIVEQGLRPMVWATGPDLKLHPRQIVDAWSVGRKQVYRVTTRNGRVIRCTDGHRFLTPQGFSELRDISAGDFIAGPRKYRYLDHSIDGTSTLELDRMTLLGWLIGDGCLIGSPAITVSSQEEAEMAVALASRCFDELRPSIKDERLSETAKRVVLTTGRMCGAGKNPLVRWLRQLGIFGLTKLKKRIPDAVFLASPDAQAAFLRGLFHADGSINSRPNGVSVVRLSTICESIAQDVQHLLIRQNIIASARKETTSQVGFLPQRGTTNRKTKRDHMWTVCICEKSRIARFLQRVGFLGDKMKAAMDGADLTKRSEAGQVDRMPAVFNQRIVEEKSRLGISWQGLGWRNQGKAMTRTRAVALARRLNAEWLLALGRSDLFWDEIESIESCGVEEVYDVTVDEMHNLCVDDLITHNSGNIEQDADIVVFVYRDSVYDTMADKNEAELLVEKHRGGETGVVDVQWIPEVMDFRDNRHQNAVPF